MDKGKKRKKKKENRRTMREKNKRVRKRTSARGGEKRVIEKIVQEIVSEREERYGKKGEQIREERLMGLKPGIERKSIKRSGRSQQVPKRVRKNRGRYRGCKWREEAGKKRAKKSGCTRKDGRRRELGRLYEERKGFSTREKGISGRKIQSEPRLTRDRRHRAAKANRVNRSQT